MRLHLPPMPSIRDIVKLYRLRASKQLSQNFLFHDGIMNKIVKQAGRIKDCHVVEVGPGPGGITRAILHRNPSRVTVIEKDRRFEPILDMLIESYAMVNGKLDVMFNDILLTDMSKLFDEELKKEWNDEPPNIHIIGNLPFSVSTPLIIKWLHAISEKRNAWEFGRVRMTLTFQKEVAERLCAPVRTPERCRLSVMAQAWTKPQLKFIIPGWQFVPAPDVDVGVVTFTPLDKPRTSNEFKLFEKVTRQLFSFRRKLSRKSAETLFPPEYRDSLVPLMYKLADVNFETSRPPMLEVEEVDRLCSAYKYICEKHPEVKMYEYRASRRILGGSYTNDVIVEDYEEDLSDDEQEAVKQ